jgi:hypothetical protein
VSAVPLTLVKQFLNITSSNQDDELIDMIDRAEGVIARRIGPLEPTVVTDEVHTGPSPIALDRWPVVSVTSATTDGITVVDLDADLASGVVYGTFSRAHRGVRVTYMAGRSTPLPIDIEAAVLELTAHLWQSQRGSAPSPLDVQDGDEAQIGSSFLLPYRVQALLEPHMLPTVA